MQDIRTPLHDYHCEQSSKREVARLSQFSPVKVSSDGALSGLLRKRLHDEKLEVLLLRHLGSIYCRLQPDWQGGIDNCIARGCPWSGSG